MYQPISQFKIKNWKVVSVDRKSEEFSDLKGQHKCMKKEIKLAQVLQRELKGKILSNVAREVGMSVSVLHDWYNSSRKPASKNLWQLKMLAEYLGLTLDEILFDDSGRKQTISTTVFTDRGVQYRVNIEKVKGS